MEGSVPTKTKRFLKNAGVMLKDDPLTVVLPPPKFIPTTVPDDSRIIVNVLWKELENYFMVRNCIAHHYGLIQNARNPEKVRKYATEKGICVDNTGQPELLLNEDYNREICDRMEKFSHKLESAYYGTPLPE